MPAVLFVHGGFAFDRGDFAIAKPFLDAGFVVMTPIREKRPAWCFHSLQVCRFTSGRFDSSFRPSSYSNVMP
jgi:hypothetical protein